MKKRSKLLWGLGTVAALGAPLATFISCGQGNSYIKTDYSGIASIVKTNDEKMAEALKAPEKHREVKVALLTAGGKINDQSFNQSLWEAISQFSFQSKVNDNIVIEPQKDAEIPAQYTELLQSGKNVWVMSGFQHGDLFVKWLNQEGNAQKLAEKKITVIAIDWTLSAEVQKKLPAGGFISLNYRTDEAGWIAGYASGKYLAETVTDAAKRNLVTFGGETGAGVTDFIAGYLAGVHYWNEKNADKKVKHASDTVELTTGFAPSPDKVTLVESIVKNNDPKIILPVAGPFTSVVVEKIKKDKSDQNVIGVDTNQSVIFKDQKGKFFTSIEKRLGSTLYRALVEMYTKTEDEANAVLKGFKPVGETGAKNVDIFKGMKDDFVGVSSTSIEGENGTKAAAALTEARSKFNELVASSSNIKSTLHIPEMENGEGKAESNKNKLNALISKINK